MSLAAPAPLHLRHETETFHCGVETLDAWLKRRALKNQASGASRTFVACDGSRVLAYYSLASGSVVVSAATGRFRRNMPNPIPVVLLARFAVDASWQGHGTGRALVRDAAHRILGAANLIGVRGLLVQAISVQAKTFYEHIGFDASPSDPMLLMATLVDLQNAL
mgnify:CR=1 FL=1